MTAAQRHGLDALAVPHPTRAPEFLFDLMLGLWMLSISIAVNRGSSVVVMPR